MWWPFRSLKGDLMGSGFQAKAVVSPQRLMRLLSLKVTGTGTAALSGTCALNCTLTDNGTGDYTITPLIPFKRVPEAFATAVTDNIYCKVGTVTASSIQILTENLSGSATDAVFHLLIIGSDTEDQS